MEQRGVAMALQTAQEREREGSVEWLSYLRKRRLDELPERKTNTAK